MLEHFTDDHDARRRRRLGPAAWLSMTAHVAALAALLVTATWRVDKLETADPPVLLAGFALPMSDGDEEQAAPKPRRKPPSNRRIVRDPVQPSTKVEEAHGGKTGTGSKQGGGLNLAEACPPGVECTPSILVGVTDPVCGNGQVEGDEECDDGGRAAGDGCSAACRREETIVTARLIEGDRIAGDPQIPPPPPVQSQMAARRQTRATGTIKMCLDRSGAVRSLRVLRSTGYPAYDELLTSRMRGWRYRPYQLSNGSAVPVCTAVTFIYQLGGR